MTPIVRIKGTKCSHVSYLGGNLDVVKRATNFMGQSIGTEFWFRFRGLTPSICPQVPAGCPSVCHDANLRIGPGMGLDFSPSQKWDRGFQNYMAYCPLSRKVMILCAPGNLPCLVLGPYSTMLRGFSWICIQELLLALLRES